MKHLGDITKLNGAEIPAVDVICGGSPCQDLSVAGKRAGLAGARSGLFMDQIRIIKEMRENDRRNGRADKFIRPRFMVWENVPGAFSSNKGEDFRAVLEETSRVADKDAVIPGPPNGKWSHSGCIMGDGWSVAWRVHDAQFWGVPQRRKRIALVADFGGECAPEILFERESVSGNTEKSGKEGKEATGNVGAGIEETSRAAATITASYGTKWNGNAGAYSGENFVIERDKAISFQERAGKPGGGKGILIQNERTGALSTLNNQPICFEPGAMSRLGGHASEGGIVSTLRANAGDNQQAICLNSWDIQSKHIQPENGIAESLYAGECRYGGGESYVMQSKVYGISSYDSNSMKSDNPNSGIYEADTSRTLDNNGGNPACNQGGMVVLEGNGSRPSHQGDGYVESETMYTLNSTEHHAVCIENHPADSRVKISEDGMVQTLSSRMGTGGGNVPMVMESEPILLESNQNHATIQTDGISTALPASMGMGGGYVPMVMESINGDISGTLDASYYKGCGERQGVEREVVCVGNGQLAQAKISDKVGALNCMHDQQAIITYGLDRASYNQGQNAKFDFCIDEEKVGAQTAKGPGAVCQSVVRRLTPLECERLQGYPCGWTDIGDWVDSRGKTHKGDADSPRYKALGNSIALPFWQWMAGRMVSNLGEHPTMASLFDGIGGFPLVFGRCGCEPVWNSEIESFPEAVTRVHFGDDERGIKGDYEQYL